MKIIRVNLKERSYDIVTGSDILGRIGRLVGKLDIGDSAYIISNPTLKKLYENDLSRALKISGLDFKFKFIPDTEKSKSFSVLYPVIQELSEYNLKRQVFIIAFGGGVVGDLAGFIASIYKRGIAYIQVATTLLAQVDSSIGGKTGVDLPQGKNLIGAFYQPKLVISDVSLLKTLDLRQIRTGLAEIIKYGIIKDPVLFAFLEKNCDRILKKELTSLEFVVIRSIYIKARIVEIDEREEKGIRTILNFGHTIGHAIETAGRYKKYNHGEAIALGMLTAADISRLLGLINTNIYQRIESLIENAGLPLKIKGIAVNDVIAAHYHDKKFSGNRNKFVLIEKIGKTKIVENIPPEIIKEALEKRK